MDFDLVIFDPWLFVRCYNEAMEQEVRKDPKKDQAKRRADMETYKKSPNYGKTYGEILMERK